MAVNMAEIKRGLFLLLGVIVYGGILYYGFDIQATLSRVVASTYDYRPLVAYSTIFPFVYGCLLTIPHLARCFHRPGKWTVDKLKIMLVVLPALIGPVLTLFSYFTPLLVESAIPSRLVAGYLANGEFFQANLVLGVIAGYVMLTSINKIDGFKGVVA